MEEALGVMAVVAGGLIMGGGAWPMKLMRIFQFEHWWFLFILIGLVIAPWTISLIAFPNLFEVYSQVPVSVLLLSNSLALIWGVANILCGLCYVRIGVGLTQAILGGLGVSVGVTLPMILKGSGEFQNAPDLGSWAGLTVLSGVGVMLIGVVLASLAGFGRDRELKKLQQTSGSFRGGLVMTIIAGIASAGLWLAFIYSQGPIVSRVSMVEAGQSISLAVSGEKNRSGEYLVGQDGSIAIDGIGSVQVAGMSAKAAADRIAGALGLSQEPETHAKVQVTTGNILAVFPVWAIGALSGALLNLLYPAYLMTKKRSWRVLATSWKEVGFSAIMGLETCLAIALPAKGMILLGALGASIGFGIQQAMQMAGGQGLGFISGEWRGVHGKPRRQMVKAIIALVIASTIMACSNFLVE
jgi:hypothetical protein